MSRKRRRWLIVPLLAVILPLVSVLIVSQGDATAQLAPENFQLSDGWNIIGWTGSAAIEPRELIETTQTPVSRLIAFDPTDGSFPGFDLTLPAIFNSLTTVAVGAGLWTFSDGHGAYPAPVPALPRTLHSRPGSIW